MNDQTQHDAAALTVVHSTGSWLPLTENWIYTQVKYLPDDVACHVLCRKTANVAQYGVPNMHVYNSETSALQRCWDGVCRDVVGTRSPGFFRTRARRIGPRVVHSHFGVRGWCDIPLAQRAGAAHVTTFYGYDVHKVPQGNPKWRARYRELFAAGDLFLCEGPHMARCLQRLGCPPGKVRVQHLGIPVGDIRFAPRRYSAGEPLRALIAASFVEKKGIPYALEALGKLQRRMPVVVTIIGDARGANHRCGAVWQFLRRSRRTLKQVFGRPNSGPATEKMRIVAALESSGLMSNATLLGYQPRDRLLAEAYRHHIFLSPSVTAADGDTEGGAPVAIIEMAATGMPVVATNHCDIPEVLRYGDGSWLAEERDVEGLAGLIEQWLHHANHWPDLLARQRHYIEHEFDAVRQGGRLAELYRQL